MSVVITGASKGIGRYLFEHFSKTQRTLGTFLTSNCGLDELQPLDVRDPASVAKLMGSLQADLPRELVLVNCAGVSFAGFAHKADPEAWANVIETNLIGTYNVIRGFLPLMRERGYGRIINFGSVVAQRGVPGTSAYAASKAGLWGMTKAIAAENGSKGVTINTINLGYSDIGMGQTEISPEHKAKLIGEIPVKRFALPQEIASSVEFFIQNEYANGTAIDLNGAWI